MRHCGLLLVLLLVPFVGRAQPAAERPPNVVLLFADDMGYGDAGTYGHPTIRTPHLDRMAREGMRLTQFYSASPACTASRYALLTGRLPVRSGFSWVLYPQSERGLHPREVTLAEGLKQAGYATAAYGKWHLGTTRAGYLPLQQGFDEYFGLPYSNDMRPPRWAPIPLMEGNDTLATNPDQSTLTRRYTERGLDFIQRHRDQPFFLYLPYAMPHLPLAPGAAFAGQSPRGRYGDVIEEIDWSVGQILEVLRAYGLAEQTLVVFTSDNGPWIIKGARGGSAGLLRDGKGSTWEGGIRAPMIAWAPGRIPAGTVQQTPVTTMDLYTSILRWAGQAPPTDRPVDGRDVRAVLTGAADSLEATPLFFYGPDSLHAVRHGPWKLHVRTSSQTGAQYFDGAVPLLFHLEHDPSEQYDLSEAYPEVVERLTRLIETHAAAVEAAGTFFDE